MATTYRLEFPLYFPFWFCPERETAAVRKRVAVRELDAARETPV